MTRSARPFTTTPIALTGVTLLLVIVFLAPLSVVAKCVSDRYVVAGTVRDGAGAPIAGATVELQWPVVGDPAFGQSVLATDTNGNYKKEFWFDRFSGQTIAGFDKCDLVLRSLTVLASVPGYIGASIEVPATAEKLAANLRLLSVADRKK